MGEVAFQKTSCFHLNCIREVAICPHFKSRPSGLQEKLSSLGKLDEGYLKKLPCLVDAVGKVGAGYIFVTWWLTMDDDKFFGILIENGISNLRFGNG